MITENTQIQGAVTQQLSDVVGSMIFLLPGVLWRKFLRFYVVFFCAFCLTFAYFDAQGQRGFGGALNQLGRMPVHLWVRVLLFGLLIFWGWFLFYIISSLIGFLRKPRGSRELLYLVDHRGIRLSDARGFERMIPWTSVSRAVEFRGLLLLHMNRKGWNCVMLRGFMKDDRRALLHIARDAAMRWRRQ